MYSVRSVKEIDIDIDKLTEKVVAECEKLIEEYVGGVNEIYHELSTDYIGCVYQVGYESEDITNTDCIVEKPGAKELEEYINENCPKWMQGLIEVLCVCVTDEHFSEIDDELYFKED